MFKFSNCIDIYMSNGTSEKKRMALMVLQESLWKVEDKQIQMIENLADHEAELIRLRRLITQTSERLQTLESRSTSRKYRKSAK